jgi:ubiquinone/menaquinone biosynthesis C-methylase UbiE
MNAGTPDINGLKARLKATWMEGDYGLIARSIEGGAEAFIERLALEPGARVLDVACGSGNLAIAAARRGAAVTGVDIAPNLLEQARARAAAEGLAVRFDEGDAEELPYPDESFDEVVTMFGAMFAPRPERAAAEMVRACRPGGRVAMANWTPAGFTGQMFRLVASYAPPPPNVPPPVQWGDPAIVRERLRDGVAELRTEPRTCPFRFPFPPSETVEYFRTYYGPMSQAFARLDEGGQAALRRELVELWTEHNRAADGSTHIESEYLEVIAVRS